MDRRPQRRRAPAWVRDFDSKALHALAYRLRRQQERTDLTARQVWLFDMIVNELEYRHRRALRFPQKGRACVCELCIMPRPRIFDQDDEVPF